MATARFLAGLALAGLVFAASGCQSGDSGGVLGLGGSQEKKPQEGKVLASELLAYCPKVVVKEPEGFINRYAKGGEGDAAKLIFQASISESTRSCSRTTGMLAMKVAVAGRVVPGPASPPGAVTLPIKVSVVRSDGEVLYSQTYNHQVGLAGNQAQQFVFNDPNVVVPIPDNNTLQVFAGFDVPAKKKQDEDLF
ncbi:hypothetical protein ABUE31_13105 [Mesorhizobium sp. ZMM04-5]|uniref:Lipoprotein n=1 Tax=Mesorhizobium marinum TaxID=3228790 RepID=A0ABV3R1U4_9HYPH